MSYIYRYYQSIQKYSPIRLIIELTVLSQLLKVGVVNIFLLFAYYMGFVSEASNAKIFYDTSHNWVEFILNTGFIAPFIETILFQLLPFLLLTKFKVSKRNQAVTIVAIFALSHLSANIRSFVASVPFVFLSTLAFFAKQKISTSSAFWHTMLLHVVVNLTSLASFFISIP